MTYEFSKHFLRELGVTCIKPRRFILRMKFLVGEKVFKNIVDNVRAVEVYFWKMKRVYIFGAFNYRAISYGNVGGFSEPMDQSWDHILRKGIGCPILSDSLFYGQTPKSRCY